MSGKEPLLAALKGCIRSLQEGTSSCTDTSPHLHSFCEILEMILRKGIKQPVLGFKRRDYWHWIEQLPHQGIHCSTILLSIMIEKTNSSEKVLTAQGRGRYFLRQALNGKLLAVVFQQLVRAPRLLEWYDPVTSILGNEDFLEPFLSLMLVVTEMSFSLDVQNSSFLDESWQLPVCLTYETVPCKELGMVLRYLDGRVFIIDLLPQSQAEVDEVVLIGDVIDEINGFSLRNAYNGQAGNVLQKLKGKPLSFHLIRWKGHDGGMYKPLLPYLKVLREKIPNFRFQHEHRRKKENEGRCLQGGRLLYNLQYLGRVNVGKNGGKEMLDEGIPMVLEKCLAPQEVLFDVKETEVLVQQKISSKVLFHYSYTEVSCVGRRLDSHNLFAFCIVASPGSPEHSSFDCLVFQSNSEEESEEIIRRIAVGFKHTEWFV
ncbi:uncharacterized protein LOC125429561 isoform X2 [Sphaerodactylus townsendi]|uniref:uncharacterized protein LOC125429561 isoform X2 n=1 Tax=Sphaerodactylus townsendi TaxID=933632 RepID=UPI002025CD1D|nr:uncharacterized protein LOC125429561 isoform X2 [Sphaerodactylus townsendi]